jgi:hypothetical protein
LRREVCQRRADRRLACTALSAQHHQLFQSTRSC